MSTWYYYNESDEKQTVTGGQLKWLAKNGKITPDTIVETEEGKKARAGKVKGLTFLNGTQAESVPSTYNTKDNGIGSLAEGLQDQDFDRLREDFKQIEQQAQQQGVPNIAKVVERHAEVKPFSVPQPAVTNPFATSVQPVINQLSSSAPPPDVTIHPAEQKRTNTVLTTIIVLPLLLGLVAAVSGITWYVLENNSEAKKNRKLNEVVALGLNSDVLSDYPMQVDHVRIDWISQSDSRMAGNFTATLKTTETLYAPIDEQYGLQKLGITDTHETAYDDALGKIESLPERLRGEIYNSLRSSIGRGSVVARIGGSATSHIYDVLVPDSGEVILTGSVEIEKLKHNDWQIVRYLVDPFSCGEDFMSSNKLPKGAVRLDDPRTKESFQIIIDYRKAFIESVKKAIAKQEEELKKLREIFAKFSSPGKRYLGSYQMTFFPSSNVARSNSSERFPRAPEHSVRVRVIFSDYRALDRHMRDGLITFELPSRAEMTLPFTVRLNPEHPAIGMTSSGRGGGSVVDVVGMIDVIRPSIRNGRSDDDYIRDIRAFIRVNSHIAILFSDDGIEFFLRDNPRSGSPVGYSPTRLVLTEVQE